MITKRISILLLIFVITGCNTPTNIDSTTMQSHQNPTITPTTNGLQSPLHTPTALPPSISCPVPLGAPALPELSSPTDWATDVLAYLNQGGSLTGLMEALPGLDQSDPRGLAAAIADLNGDGYEDFVITLTEESSQAEISVPVESILLIFLCDQEEYRLTHAASSMPDADRLHLFSVLDLTADGLGELLVMQEFCGAHTCFQAWEVLQWQTNRFVNTLDGRSDDLPSPILEISGPKDDGSMILSITGMGAQSAGAGPNRSITRFWHWSYPETLFVVAEERQAAPIFRIHALHDADQAALIDNFDAALSGYTRVIEDPALDDYPYGEQGHAQLGAYALYRNMLLWIKHGDLDQAATTLTFLQEAYPQDGHGGGFSVVADEVWQAYQAQPDLGRACQIAQAYALEHREKVLDPLNYGYTNQVYSAVDICPYTQ